VNQITQRILKIASGTFRPKLKLVSGKISYLVCHIESYVRDLFSVQISRTRSGKKVQSDTRDAAHHRVSTSCIACAKIFVPAWSRPGLMAHLSIELPADVKMTNRVELMR